MGSSFHYHINAGFKVIDQWQQIIVRNAQGLLKPGYNKVQIQFGQTSGTTTEQQRGPTRSYGGKNAVQGGGDTLEVSGTRIQFEQGTIDPAFNPTSLAIRGEGFFMLAENLAPGARLFLTRAGNFRYDNQGRLVNDQGLFVVGGNGTLTDPITPVTNPGDGTVDPNALTMGKVPAPSSLALSGYADTVYQVTGASGPIRTFANGRPEVGFIQTDSIEVPNRAGAGSLIQVDTVKATNTYKIFKDMLDNFNKATDDALGLVK